MEKRVQERGLYRRLYPALLVVLFVLGAKPEPRDDGTLRLVETISLPGIEGMLDHLAVDLKGQRLFVAALANNSLEVIDLRTGKLVRSIGLEEPQGILYVPELNRIFATSGEDGSCKIFDGDSLLPIKTLKVSDDADHIRYDPRAKRIYVGYGNGGLSILDAVSGKRVGSIPLAGHPESFQMEEWGPMIFVNLPIVSQIAVIDRKKKKVVATWSLRGAKANFPMAFDEKRHRLFIGCRKPPKLLILDSLTGKTVQRLTIERDTDDIYYDSKKKHLYVSSGEGSIQVFQELDADRYTLIQKLRTSRGARTSLFVPEQERLYLAVPQGMKQKAEIRIYAIEP